MNETNWDYNIHNQIRSSVVDLFFQGLSANMGPSGVVVPGIVIFLIPCCFFFIVLDCVMSKTTLKKKKKKFALSMFYI